jgi:PKD domain-containing protein
MKRLLPLLTLSIALAGAGTANASTFCVNAPKCAGTPKADLQAALDAALQAPGRDEVLLGANGTPYVGPFRYLAGLTNAANGVAIRAAGPGRPVLTAAPDNIILAIEASSVEGVDIQMSRSSGLNAGASDVRDVRLLGTAEVGVVAHHDARVDGLEVRGQTTLAFLAGEGNVVADRLRIAGARRAVGGSENSKLFLSHSRLSATHSGIGTRAITTAVSATTVETTAPSANGIEATGGDLSLDHVTIAHRGTGGDAALAFTREDLAGRAGMAAVALAGYARGIRRSGGEYPLAIRDSVWDPARDVAGEGLLAQSGNAHVAPALVDLAGGDLRPRGVSAAIDRDTLTDPAYEDAAGVSPVDGDGNGGVRADAGAFEYRRRAPQITAAAVPAAARTGTPVAFAASASDPDGDRVQPAWSVDGRAVSATHTFGKRGRHTVTLRVRDEAGLTASRTFSVRVADGTAPVLSALRLSKRRLRFTLSERARVRIKARGRILVVAARRGRNAVALRRRKVRRVAVRAVDAAGNRSQRRVVKLAVS